MKWQELAEIQADLKSKFEGDERFLVGTVVRFIRPWGKININTKAVVKASSGDYYALTVNGQHVEGVHKAFLRGVI